MMSWILSLPVIPSVNLVVNLNARSSKLEAMVFHSNDSNLIAKTFKIIAFISSLKFLLYQKKIVFKSEPIAKCHLTCD